MFTLTKSPGNIRVEVNTFHEIGCVSVVCHIDRPHWRNDKRHFPKDCECPQNYPLPTKDTPLHLLFRASIITWVASSFLTLQLPDWCWVWGSPKQKTKQTITNKNSHGTVFYEMQNQRGLYKKYFIYLFFRGRETTMCGCPSHTPNWGPGLQPRHVPWLGMQPATVWFTGQPSIHWATPAGFQLQF